MVDSLARLDVLRTNPLLKDFPVDEASIQEDFDCVIREYSFEAFLREQWLELYGAEMDPSMKNFCIEQYRIRLLSLLLGPAGKMMCHYTTTTLNTVCTKEENAEHRVLLDGLVAFQNTLLVKHLSDLYPQECVRAPLGLVTTTTGLVDATLIW